MPFAQPSTLMQPNAWCVSADLSPPDDVAPTMPAEPPRKVMFWTVFETVSNQRHGTCFSSPAGGVTTTSAVAGANCQSAS